MRITWYGHAAFLIETRACGSSSTRSVLPTRGVTSRSPSRPTWSSSVMKTTATTATWVRSSGRLRSSARSSCRPRATVVRGIRFQAVHVFETPERLPEDEVTIVHFRSEDLHVVFLGDLGHPLSEAELAPLRGADIVLAAAGGPPTIDFPEIPALLDAIGPRIVLPMHYKTPKINLNIQPLERFLEVLPGDPVERPGRARSRSRERRCRQSARSSSSSTHA